MDKEIADKWVKALRSGKYKQGESVLCKVEDKNVKYCCLGVLCHILGTPYTVEDGCKKYGCEEDEQAFCRLPFAVMLQTEMKSGIGRLDEFTTLSNLNDRGKSFEEIANVIEENWELL